MVLGGEEGLECEVCIDEICLEHVSEFKYSGCVLDESGKDEAKCRTTVVSGRKVAGSIRSMVHARSWQLEFSKVLHESLLVPVLTYGNEIMIYGGRRRGLGLGRYRWTTSEACWVSGECYD